MVYLDDLRRKLLSVSSARDLALYRFLNGHKHSMNVAPNDIERELCSNAFGEENGKHALIKVRKVEPFKGLHYSNNLVLLTAAAKIDIVGEEENVKKYLLAHGYRDQLIVNSALGRSFRITNKIEKPVDELALHIQENNTITEAEIQICLASISDLYDLFVVEKAIAKCILQSNEINNLGSYKSLVKIQSCALRRIEVTCYALLMVMAISSLYFILPVVTGLVVKHWDSLEPVAYLLDKGILIFFIITGLVMTTLIDSVKRRIKGFILSRLYRLMGVDYSAYLRLKSNIE